MTIETPTIETKGNEVATEELEPTLSTQAEPTLNAQAESTLNTQAEPSNDDAEEEKLTSKKKSIFNHRFSPKGTKKDGEEINAVTTDTDNKKSKPFGNFLSRVKQTATSSNNIKDLSEPTIVSENENVEHEKSAETPVTGDHAKRQSLLSKLFGNTKKEPMIDSADQVISATDDQRTNTEEVTPSSPPLSRRVTGIFSKKKISEKKQGKSSEKVETDEETPVKESENIPEPEEGIIQTVSHPITTTTTTTASNNQSKLLNFSINIF